LATDFRVSNTPTPVVATASKVELQDVGDGLQVEAVLGQVLLEVPDRFDVGFHPLVLAVGHEHDAVHALQDQLPAGVVEHLARHGVEVEAGGEAADGAQVEGQEVEEQRAVRLGREGDHLALRLRRGLVVDVLQVGRLAPEAGAVVDDLAVDLFAGVVDERHVARPDPRAAVFPGARGLERVRRERHAGTREHLWQSRLPSTH
jgi:hypothetical protein